MIKRIVVIFIIFAFFSCGNEAPTISFPMYHILVYENGALQSPNENIFLSLYFLISDDNGIDDIKSVKLTHIDTEYSWSLTKDELKSVDWENKTYHGYSFFEYDNAKSVLLGDYNIEIEDGGGNIGNTI
nr:hypothetical protein [Spirochaetota bacterium]